MNDQNLNEKITEFINKIEKMKKEDKMDLSSNEDLSIAIMNLISIEEHFFFTGAKTGKTKYYDLIREVREMRKELLKKIIKEYEGEVWCISKHLLAASYRLMEVGTKQLSIGKNKEAYDLFDKAYALYSLFWGLNLKLINASDIKKINDNALNKHDKDEFLKEITNENYSSEKDSKEIAEENNPLKKLGKLIKKAIDCCIE
jgi:hypothetical protein